MTTPRLATLDDSWERESRRSQRALLTAERDALVEVDAATQRATEAVILALGLYGSSESTKLAGLAAVQRAADQLRQETARAVSRGRAAARAAALVRLQGELQLAARQLGVAAIDAPQASDAAEDGPLAHADADALSAAWRAGAAAAVLAWADNPQKSIAERVREVARAHAYRRRRVAATAVSRAFNDEHGEGVAWLGETYSPAGVRLALPGQGPLTAASEAARLGVSAEEYQRTYAYGRTLTREERVRRALRKEAPRPTALDAPPVRPGEGPADPALSELHAWARPLVGKLMQRWEAALDARTCPFCHGMNGALTLLDRPFTNGYVPGRSGRSTEPGSPHPNCRCLSTIIVLTPKLILENEKRAELKTRAVLAFETKLPKQAQAEAAQQALTRLRR